MQTIDAATLVMQHKCVCDRAQAAERKVAELESMNTELRSIVIGNLSHLQEAATILTGAEQRSHNVQAAFDWLHSEVIGFRQVGACLRA